MGELNVKVLRSGGAVKASEKVEAPEIDPEKQVGPKARAMITKFAGAYYSKALRDLGQFNPYKISYEQMYMMAADPMIKMALTYIMAPLVNAPWRCEGEDPQQVAFAENALKDIYISFVKTWCNRNGFGHAAMIKRFKREVPTWKYTDPETGEEVPVWPDEKLRAIVWSEPRGLPPETVEPNFTSDGEEFDGLKYKAPAGLKDKNDTNTGGGPKEEIIPVGLSLWTTNEKEESFGNWAGYPRTGYAFRYWWSYWFRYILADRHFEHDADPPMHVKYPPGISEDETGQPIQNADIALSIGDQLREGATIATPSTPYVDDVGKPTSAQQWEVEFLKGGENMAVYETSFDNLNVMKLRACLVPEEALIEGAHGTGSRFTAGVRGNSFKESLGILMAELDRDINKFMIPDLIKLNFAEPKVVRKVTTGFREIDVNIGMRLLEYIANQNSESLPIDVKELLDLCNIPTLKVNIDKTGPVEEPEESNVPPEEDPTIPPSTEEEEAA